MTLADQTIRTQNADIRITQSSGPGMAVLLLHGSGSNRAIFERQMQAPLADRFRLIAMDLPGHGESSNVATNSMGQAYTLPGLASTVGEVVDQLGLARVAVFGWSLGGHIALELMSFHRAVAGVMLMGAPPIGRGPVALLRAFRSNLDTMLASKVHFSDSDVARFASLCYGEGAQPAHLDSIRRADGNLRRVMFSSMIGGRCADEKGLVETSPNPIAIINGSGDPFVRLKYLASLKYAALWDGMCHIIPNAGHAAFWERSDDFNPLLARFASDLEARQIAKLPQRHDVAARSA